MRSVVSMWSIAVIAFTVIAVGCGAPDDDDLVVFAASSLTDVFDDLAADFEAAHAGIDVTMSYAGSSSLVAQLSEGAPADVLATADLETMQRAELAGVLAGPARVFATNRLVIVVERGNPLGITSLADLAGAPVVVLAAPEVPAGAYARDVLDAAGVDVRVASFESNVRAVAAKVALGEADAGLVYRTDVTGELDGIELPDAVAVRADYPIALTSDDPNAAEFVEFVLGAAAANRLAEAGFGVP